YRLRLALLDEASGRVQLAEALRPADRRRGAVLLPALLPVLQVPADLSDQVRQLVRARVDRPRRDRACDPLRQGARSPRRHGAGLRRGRDRDDRPDLRADRLMATAVGHRIGRDEIIWAFGPDLEPVLEIDPGETVTFETNDCFTGQITSE